MRGSLSACYNSISSRQHIGRPDGEKASNVSCSPWRWARHESCSRWHTEPVSINNAHEKCDDDVDVSAQESSRHLLHWSRYAPRQRSPHSLTTRWSLQPPVGTSSFSDRHLFNQTACCQHLKETLRFLMGGSNISNIRKRPGEDTLAQLWHC